MVYEPVASVTLCTVRSMEVSSCNVSTSFNFSYIYRIFLTDQHMLERNEAPLLKLSRFLRLICEKLSAVYEFFT